MTCMRLFGKFLTVAVALAATGCFSSAPPAPPVRYFDPTVRLASAPAKSAGAFDVRVVAPPHLGRQFVVRVDERELTFDAGHSWIVEPTLLVLGAVEQHLGPGSRAADVTPVAIVVENFELDVVAAPKARVRLHVAVRGSRYLVTAEVKAADRSPAAFATAMAQALADAAAQVAEVVVLPGGQR